MNYKTQTIMGETAIWYEQEGVRISFTNPSPGNTDYAAYLAWLAEGNEPEIIES